MPKEPELKARDKVVMKMTRDGAVEENLTEGTSKSISGRLKDAELVKPIEEPELSGGLSAEEQKKVQMRRQQRQFREEHKDDTGTQPTSETPVSEEKKPENPPQNAHEAMPVSETPLKPPFSEPHSSTSHTGAVIAETVVTHKLRKTAAVQNADADDVLSKAAETAANAPKPDAEPSSPRVQKLERKAEKAHERLDAAIEAASRSEGLPFNIMEAMACGLPAAASAVKGHTDLIGPENGLLFPRGDEAALAAAVRTLAEDAGLRARLGQAGREKMQRYALDTVLPQVMERYLSVTGDKGKRI